jgi:hypothetical protein
VRAATDVSDVAAHVAWVKLAIEKLRDGAPHERADAIDGLVRWLIQRAEVEV